MSKKQNKKNSTSWINPDPKEPQWIQDFYFSEQQDGQTQTKTFQPIDQSDLIIRQQTYQKQGKHQQIPSNINSDLSLQQNPLTRNNKLPQTNNQQLRQQSFHTQSSKQSVQNLFKNNQQRVIQAIGHFLQTTQNQKLRQKMKGYLKDIQQNKIPIHDALIKMSSSDVALINSHRLFILSFEETVNSLLSLGQFKKFKKIDFLQLFKSVYTYINELIQFQQLTSGMKIQISLRYQNIFSNDKIEKFVDFFFRRCLFLYQTKQMEFKRAHNRAMRESKGSGLNNEDEIENQTRIKYDGKSQYDIFRNANEEAKIGPQGVYRYRLHRTIYFLEKHNFINPKQNSLYLQRAKDIAVFIIKLTDLHIRQIIKEAILNAKISGQNKVFPSSKTVCDEVSYFTKGKYAVKQFSPIERYKFPCLLKKYFRLRGQQLWRQDFLYKTLYPQVYVTLSHTRNKDHPHQQIINDYFHCARVSQQSKEEFKKYKKPKPITSNIRIQPKHIINLIENHRAYQNKIVVFRLKVLF